MSYSHFTIADMKTKFGLRLAESEDLFGSVPPAAISPLLGQILDENVPLALANSTEKARAEFIIAPILSEVRRHAGGKASLFSGIDFPVDPARQLAGTCDFLLSRSPEQWTIEAPVVVVVEAKNENMKAGIGQCLAEMVAARVFNERNGREIPAIYGAVTTGDQWRFLRLIGETAWVDRAAYPIQEVDRIVAILVGMVLGELDEEAVLAGA
ncbi:MAG: hypothetical protein U0800_20675 [Isosphaeraceae bacterium]